MHCVNDWAERNRQLEEALELDYQDFINRRQAELMEGEYNPFVDDHFHHAICEMSEPLTQLICKVAKQGNYQFLGEIIANHVRNFWNVEAFKQVEKEMIIYESNH